MGRWAARGAASFTVLLMDRIPTLTTQHLRLRSFVLADAPVVQTLAGAREIADTTLLIPHPYPDGVAETWIATHDAAWATGASVTYAMTRREAGDLVGAIGLTISAAHASAELGYWVGVPYWNLGYCTEAARAVLTFGFEWLGLHRIHAHHLTRNPASGRVMEKIGMRLEGVHRDAVRKWDRFEDIAVYGILASEHGARTE
jgi:RimJ/RimL family protein N-acetyltransferase